MPTDVPNRHHRIVGLYHQAYLQESVDNRVRKQVEEKKEKWEEITYLYRTWANERDIETASPVAR